MVIRSNTGFCCCYVGLPLSEILPGMHVNSKIARPPWRVLHIKNTFVWLSLRESHRSWHLQSCREVSQFPMSCSRKCRGSWICEVMAGNSVGWLWLLTAVEQFLMCEELLRCFLSFDIHSKYVGWTSFVFPFFKNVRMLSNTLLNIKL